MFQAPLNTLREEMRTVAERRARLLADEDLRIRDPRHRAQLLDQGLTELSELAGAVRLLEGREAQA
jgi:hypothetical protein